jgi:hypothetical protein
MSRRNIILLSILMVAVIFGLVAWKWVFRPAEKSVEAEKAEVVIDATALVQQFETNEAAANAAYNDKVILVTGTIESITDDGSGLNLSLKNPGEISGVLCNFDKNSVAKEDFVVGRSIKVKGRCAGFLMDVYLNKCSISE